MVEYLGSKLPVEEDITYQQAIIALKPSRTAKSGPSGATATQGSKGCRVDEARWQALIRRAMHPWDQETMCREGRRDELHESMLCLAGVFA